MSEYVYALHDFLPENEDEVSFHAGERIEVVEKDDQYGDGWWQGRNLAGKVGLFPQSYTTSTPPAEPRPASPEVTEKPTENGVDHTRSTSTALQPLAEEEYEHEPESPVAQSPAPAIYLNGQDTHGDIDHKEVMQATLTDVQQAIEQLGRRRDGDGEQSFSFASSRGDETDDTDFDESDAGGDHDPDTEGGEGWHKGARRKLAEKARRAVEEAEKLEMMMGNMGSRSRILEPPIEVELSDESEGEEEEEEYTGSSYFRRHSAIPEQDEEGTSEAGSVHREAITVPDRDETELPTATAAVSTFPDVAQSPEPVPPPSPTPLTPVVEPVIVPSPAASVTNGVASRFSTPSKHNSVASAISATSSTTPATAPTSAFSGTSLQPTLVEERERKDKTHPSEWTVDDVVDWLKSKGFGQEVYDKFTEQEITGDVLLELDVNLLKTEIGIIAFGKRMRIANAITDLRRPPSISYSDHNQHSPSAHVFNTNGQQMIQQQQQHVFPHPQSPMSQHSGQSQHTHSRAQSQSYSHHSYQGSFNGNGFGTMLSPEGPVNGNGNGQGHAVGEDGTMFVASPEDGLGVGFSSQQGQGQGNGKVGKRPAQLSLSPSAGNLKTRPSSDIIEEGSGSLIEDSGALSESEVTRTSQSMRRRLFGRSHDSGASAKDVSPASNRNSKDGISPNQNGSLKDAISVAEAKDEDSVQSKDKSKDKDTAKEAGTAGRHARAKKSVDAGKTGEHRISIFGSAFGGSVGKNTRKPAPRYSVAATEEAAEKGSSFHLPRLGTGRKASGGRPSTPGGTPKTSPKEGKSEKEKEKQRPTTAVRESKEGKDGKDPQVLRKRTSSYPGPNATVLSADSPKSGGGVTSPLKPGQGFWEQVGDPDHSGWMKKKGERYNNWKLRYFVLKGPHLYYLRGSTEAKIKGYINIVGYKVTVDENVNPGRYGFRIDHDNDKTHYFCSDEKVIVRDWMKAIMKATIGRDYTKPVISSCNIPTIPLMVAQAMNPAPRPPSPTAREATQKAMRRENPNQLSQRDARILMGLPTGSDNKEERTRLDSFFSNQSVDSSQTVSGPSSPVKPPRPARRLSSQQPPPMEPVDENLIEWANSHLPSSLQITDPTGPLCSGLGLLRLAESIKGRPSDPPVPDSVFPRDANDDKLDGLFKLFDFMLDNDVKMGSVSINDVRQGKRDKIIQLLRALRTWEDKRKAIALSINGKASLHAGGFMAPVHIGGPTWSG